jgi:hypothetical protein
MDVDGRDRDRSVQHGDAPGGLGVVQLADPGLELEDLHGVPRRHGARHHLEELLELLGESPVGGLVVGVEVVDQGAEDQRPAVVSKDLPQGLDILGVEPLV